MFVLLVSSISNIFYMKIKKNLKLHLRFIHIISCFFFAGMLSVESKYKMNHITCVSLNFLAVVQLLGHILPWAHQAPLSFTVSQTLLIFMFIESVILTNRFILCSLLLLPSIFPRITVFYKELALHISWPKYWNFSFNISPSNEYSGLISFRMDWFDLAIQGTLRSLLSTTIWKLQFFDTKPSLWYNSRTPTWLLEKS